MAYKINQRSLLFNAFIEESKQILKKLAIEVLEKWNDMERTIRIHAIQATGGEARLYVFCGRQV